MNRDELNNQELEMVSAGAGEHVDQYKIQINHAYLIYFPMQNGPLVMDPYGARSGHTYRIMVYRVYEAPGLLWGTNRTVDGIDMDNGEYVTVCVNENNVWELD